MRFFTSDTHFGHKRIIELCNRSYRDVDHMNNMIVQEWNRVVQPNDEVFHLGDVALGPWTEWDSILTRLNGDKFLVIGNHDRVFGENKESHRLRFGEHYARWFNTGMSEHVTSLPIDVDGEQVFVNLSHFPYDGDSHGDERYREYRLEDKGVPLIHGHTHSAGPAASLSKNGTPMFHVGWDAWYTPVPETRIVNWLKDCQRWMK